LGALPETVTAKTGGGGQHLFFKQPSFNVRKDTAGKLFGRGIDVLSDGSIVVAPPSRHASGRRYAWVKGKSFQDIEPAKLPKAWRKRLRGDAALKSTRNNAKPETPGQVSQGQRNNHLTRLAGLLQRSGMSAEAILAALRAENDAKCNPALGTSEVMQILKSIGRYPALGDATDAAEALIFETALPVGRGLTSPTAKPVRISGGCRIEQGDGHQPDRELWPARVVTPPQGDFVASPVDDNRRPPAFDQSVLGEDDVPRLYRVPVGGQVGCDRLARFSTGFASWVDGGHEFFVQVFANRRHNAGAIGMNPARRQFGDNLGSCPVSDLNNVEAKLFRCGSSGVDLGFWKPGSVGLAVVVNAEHDDFGEGV
jgi:hypothetical protein